MGSEMCIRDRINNGLTPDEIMAMLIHASVYAGVPSSLTGVRIAKKVFSELGVI